MQLTERLKSLFTNLTTKMSRAPIGKKDNISDTSASDSGYQQYQVALKADVLHGLSEGKWVAYNNGKLVAAAEDNDELMQLLDKQKLSGEIFTSKVEVSNQGITAPSLMVGKNNLLAKYI